MTHNLLSSKIKYYPKFDYLEPFEISIIELQNKFNFIYLDNFIEYSNDFTYCSKINLDIALPRLTSFFLRNTSSIGVGLYANKVFYKDDIISIYAGSYTNNKESNLYRSYFPYKDEYRLSLADAVVSSSNVGNITRFIQHAFSSKEDIKKFYNDNFTNCFVAKIALANCKFKISSCGKPIVVALRDINIGEQLLIDYGASYWQKSYRSPVLFSYSGNVIYNASRIKKIILLTAKIKHYFKSMMFKKCHNRL